MASSMLANGNRRADYLCAFFRRWAVRQFTEGRFIKNQLRTANGPTTLQQQRSTAAFYNRHEEALSAAGVGSAGVDAVLLVGGAARLDAVAKHAARALNVGDAVTITYGEHESTHFALYYGFVPEPNPHDALQVSLSDVLSTLPADQLEPEGGWASALEALAQADDESAEGGSSALASHMYDLKAVGPSTALIAMLSRLLPPPPGGSVEASACRAVASTVSAIENALWQYGADGAAESVGADEALLASEIRVLRVKNRLSRKYDAELLSAYLQTSTPPALTSLNLADNAIGAPGASRGRPAPGAAGRAARAAAYMSFVPR